MIFARLAQFAAKTAGDGSGCDVRFLVRNRSGDIHQERLCPGPVDAIAGKTQLIALRVAGTYDVDFGHSAPRIGPALLHALEAEPVHLLLVWKEVAPHAGGGGERRNRAAEGLDRQPAIVFHGP